jgi:hypothetical protein
LIMTLLVSCGGDRPAVDEWQSEWTTVVQALPRPADLDVADPGELCGTALAMLREERLALVPSPVAEVDAVVEAWLELAEETFFECPPRSGDLQGFGEAFERLAAYETEIESGLS